MGLTNPPEPPRPAAPSSLVQPLPTPFHFPKPFRPRPPRPLPSPPSQPAVASPLPQMCTLPAPPHSPTRPGAASTSHNAPRRGPARPLLPGCPARPPASLPAVPRAAEAFFFSPPLPHSPAPALSPRVRGRTRSCLARERAGRFPACSAGGLSPLTRHTRFPLRLQLPECLARARPRDVSPRPRRVLRAKSVAGICDCGRDAERVSGRCLDSGS